MDEILKLDNIFQYNDMMGQETLHPLVSVVDFRNASLCCILFNGLVFMLFF